MRATGFRSEGDVNGAQWGVYSFEDGSTSFGPRDEEYDQQITGAQTPDEPPEDLRADEHNGPVIPGTNLSLSDQPTDFAPPITEEDDAPEQASPVEAAPVASSDPTVAAARPDSLVDMNAQQEQERRLAAQKTQQAIAIKQEQEASRLEKEGQAEAMRIRVQQEELGKQQQEQARKMDRLAEQKKIVEATDLKPDFNASTAAQLAIVAIAAVLGGGYAANTAVKAMSKNLDDEMRLKMQEKGSRIDRLADELGSEEQAFLAMKAKGLQLTKQRVEAQAKLDKSKESRENAPLLIAELEEKQLEAEHEFQRKSMAAEIDYSTDEIKQQLDSRGAARQDAELGIKQADLRLRQEAMGLKKQEAALKSQATGAKPGPGIRNGLDLNAPIGTEVQDAATRDAYAELYDPGDSKDRGSMTAYSRNFSQIAGLKQTLNSLSKAYGVNEDDNGFYPEKSDTYATGATGPGMPFDIDAVFDVKSTRHLKDLWAKVEENTRSTWKAEPNGEAAQKKFQQINVPKRDVDVGLKLNELRMVIQRMEQESGAAAGAHVRAAYAKRKSSPLASGGRGFRPTAEDTKR